MPALPQTAPVSIAVIRKWGICFFCNHNTIVYECSVIGFIYCYECINHIADHEFTQEQLDRTLTEPERQLYVIGNQFLNQLRDTINQHLDAPFFSPSSSDDEEGAPPIP